MNTEQERAAFEVWYQHHHGDLDVYALDRFGEYVDKQVQGAFNVWQARAALQSQDAERLQAAARDIFVRAREIEILYGTNKETEGLVNAAIWLAHLVGPSEQSIDHARRAEGGGT